MGDGNWLYQLSDTVAAGCVVAEGETGCREYSEPVPGTEESVDSPYGGQFFEDASVLGARKSGKGGHAGEVLYQYSVAVTLANEKQYLKKHHANKDILPYTPVIYQMPEKAADKPAKPPVIIGSGPAGLFCGLMLARQGYDPIILERGSEVHTRMEKVNAFWAGGKLDKECNVQFGEGGAGTFSDGKLNTLVKDPFGRQRTVMETFVEAGAPAHILYV